MINKLLEKILILIFKPLYRDPAGVSCILFSFSSYLGILSGEDLRDHNEEGKRALAEANLRQDQ